MKRIFIVQNTPLNEPLPLSIYLTGLLRNFEKNKDFEINLIIGKSKKIPKEITLLCNKIYQLDSNTYSIKDNIKFSFKVNSILKKENKEKNIDTVHCFYPNSSLLGGVLFKITNPKIKLIYDVRSPWIDMSIERGFINKYIAPIYKKTIYSEEKFLCKFVDSFMFVTKGLADHYKEKLKLKENQKIYVSPSGADLTIFKKTKTNIRKKYNIKNIEILIGSVGGIAKVRKQDEFLYIFKKVLSKNKKIKLMFVGEGDLLEDLKKKTKELKLEDNVIFVGKVEHKEIPKYISAFDYGLSHLPDMFIHRNNFSLKILEYLGCKTPVLASKIKSNTEISKQLSGVYIYNSAKDILNIINKNKKIKIQIPKNLKEYSWPSLAKNYEKMWGY